MKKTIFMILSGLLFSLSSNAQSTDRLPFAKDKIYVSASLSNLGLSYSKTEDWKLGMHARAGYLFEDDWMALGTIGYDYYSNHSIHSNLFTAGVGLRYYIEQNGLFLGAGANYVHEDRYDDFMPTVELGYSFFLNRTVTLEPSVYYNQSLKDHSNYSGFGLRIGVGIYFE